MSLTRARRCRKRGSPRCPPPQSVNFLRTLHGTVEMCSFPELFFSEVHLDWMIRFNLCKTQTPHRPTHHPSPRSIWHHIGGRASPTKPKDLLQINDNKTTSQTDQLCPPLLCPCSLCFRLNCSFYPPYFAQELEWMERNANLQISKEILRNQCEKVTQQTWPDWGGRWRNWGVGVRGPQ